MPKDLKLVGCREAIELQHDRWVERSDVAVPDIVSHASEKDVGIAPFECAHHRQFGNGMALPKILTQEKRVDVRGVAAYDHVLVIVRKNLGLDEVTLAQQIR